MPGHERGEGGESRRDSQTWVDRPMVLSRGDLE